MSTKEKGIWCLIYPGIEELLISVDTLRNVVADPCDLNPLL